jgi:hypothetical protein
VLLEEGYAGAGFRGRVTGQFYPAGTNQMYIAVEDQEP